MLQVMRKFECTEGDCNLTQQTHLYLEIHDLVENYSLLLRQLWNQVTENRKVAVVLALQRPAGLEVGWPKVNVKSLAQDSLASNSLAQDSVCRKALRAQESGSPCWLSQLPNRSSVTGRPPPTTDHLVPGPNTHFFFLNTSLLISFMSLLKRSFQKVHP